MAAYDAANASAIRTGPALGRASSGYMGASDGWTDLRDDHRMDWSYDEREPGNVVQLAATPLTGLKGNRHLTLALGFGASPGAAAQTAAASLRTGFGLAAARYAAAGTTTWTRCGGRAAPPASSSSTTRP